MINKKTFIKWTHYGSIYGIPIFIDLRNTREPTIGGTNCFFDFLIEYFVMYIALFLSFFKNDDDGYKRHISENRRACPADERAY